MITLRKLRIGLGLSQQQVADTINVKQRTVSQWERLESLPNLADAVLLARCYQVPLLSIVECFGINTEGL